MVTKRLLQLPASGPHFRGEKEVEEVKGKKKGLLFKRFFFFPFWEGSPSQRTSNLLARTHMGQFLLEDIQGEGYG